MEKKIPLNIGLEILVNPDVVRFNEFRFISPHFGFVNSFAKIESNLITVDQPYRIKEGRIAVIKQGYARVLINLIEETFQPDKLLVIVPNSILQIIEVSPDFDMQMVGMDAEFLSIAGKDNFFTHLSQLQKNLILSLTSHEYDLFCFNMEYITRTDVPTGSYSISTNQSFVQYRISCQKQQSKRTELSDTSGRDFPAFHFFSQCL